MTAKGKHKRSLNKRGSIFADLRSLQAKLQVRCSLGHSLATAHYRLSSGCEMRPGSTVAWAADSELLCLACDIVARSEWGCAFVRKVWAGFSLSHIFGVVR